MSAENSDRSGMKLDKKFFARDALEVAPDLVGKALVHRMPDGSEKRLIITETEAYRGEEDTACHAHRGKTKRTSIMYLEGGKIYVYLCYGMHWLLNIVTGPEDYPQAVLIRACEGAEGPGKLTKALSIDGSFNGAEIFCHKDLWLEDNGASVNITLDKRVGIKFASTEDIERLWRFKRG